MALTKKQRQMIAIAKARARLAQKQPMTPEEYMARNAQIEPEYGAEASPVEQAGRGMMDVYQGVGQMVGSPEYKKQLWSLLSDEDKSIIRSYATPVKS